MTIIQKLQARNVITKVARQHGISTSQCRTAIREAITIAWATTDPEVKQTQIGLVGDSHIPSPEEFILLISQKIS